MVSVAFTLAIGKLIDPDNLRAILKCIILRGQFSSPFALIKYIREFKTKIDGEIANAFTQFEISLQEITTLKKNSDLLMNMPFNDL